MVMIVRNKFDATKEGYKVVNKQHLSWRHTDDIRASLKRAFPDLDFPYIEQDHLYGVKSDVHTYCHKHQKVSRVTMAGLLYGGNSYGCDACAWENGKYNRLRAYKNKPIHVSGLESGIFHALKMEFPDTTTGLLPDGKEVDIWVPSIGFGVEFDGNYFHTESKGRGGDYHVKKTVLGNQCGVGITHLWTEEAVAPFTNIVNIAKLERDKPQLKLKESTRIETITEQRALDFYKNWSTKHPYFAKQCDTHIGVVHRGSVRMALSYRSEDSLVTMVATNYHNSDLSFLITHLAKTLGVPINWLCDFRSGSDAVLMHSMMNHKFRYVKPMSWALDKNSNIAQFSGSTSLSGDVVWDSGYTVFTVYP